MRRLALLLLALAFLAPAASAQLGVVETTLTTYVDDPGPVIFPASNASLVVHVNYNWDPGARPTPNPTQDRPENTTPTTITLAVKTVPSWVKSAAIVPDTLLVDLGDPRRVSGDRAEMTAALILEVVPGAPAFVKEDVVVTASAAENGNLAPSTAESQPLPIKVQEVAALNVTAADRLVIPGGRWTNVAFAVRNDGNTDSVAKLNVTLKPESSQVEFPTTLELKRGETKVVDVRIRTPWNAAEFGDLELEATPIIEGQEGVSASAAVGITGQSAVPGAGAVGAAGAVLLVALLRRRA